MDIDRLKLIEDIKKNSYVNIIKSKVVFDDELFNLACQYCDLMIIVHLVEQKKAKIKDLSVFSACKRKDDLVIRYLVSKKIKLPHFLKTYRVSQRNSCLSIACIYGSLDIVQFLVEEQKYPLYSSSTKIPTPLFDALSQKHTHIVTYLLEQSKKQKMKYENDILIIAISQKNRDVIKYMIDNNLLICEDRNKLNELYPEILIFKDYDMI